MTKVHPIEHLRYVARSHGADPVDIALGAADALSQVARDSAATVVSARRLVEHHPLNAPLWTVCAHAVTAMDPYGAVEVVASKIAHDQTATHLREGLASAETVCTVGWSGHLVDALVRHRQTRALVVDSWGDGQDALRHLSRREIECELIAPEGLAAAVEYADATVISAIAVGGTHVLCAGGSLAVASVAYCASKPVWLVVAEATRLPDSLFEPMVAMVRDRPDPWAAGVDLVPFEMVSHVYSPLGSELHVSSIQNLEISPSAPELLPRSV